MRREMSTCWPQFEHPRRLSATPSADVDGGWSGGELVYRASGGTILVLDRCRPAAPAGYTYSIYIAAPRRMRSKKNARGVTLGASHKYCLRVLATRKCDVFCFSCVCDLL